MSSNSPQTPVSQEIQTLRTQLRADLDTFLDTDVHISGYIVAWISRNLPLDQLEALVDELDSVFVVGGRSILGRKITPRNRIQ